MKGITMYKLEVTCKGARAIIGEFAHWAEFEQLVHTQGDETVWQWFDRLISNLKLGQILDQHLVTVSQATGATVVYHVREG